MRLTLTCSALPRAPDFRSADGLYAKLQAEGRYELDDPQQMFDIRYFKNHPDVFFSFAHQIYPTNFTPSPCHRWIKTLEDQGKVRCRGLPPDRASRP